MIKPYCFQLTPVDRAVRHCQILVYQKNGHECSLKRTANKKTSKQSDALVGIEFDRWDHCTKHEQTEIKGKIG